MSNNYFETNLKMETLPRFEKVVSEGVMNEYQQAQYNKLVAVVEGKGGKVKVGVYITCKSYFVLTCEKGCDWVANYNNIVDGDNWCGVCGSNKLSIEHTQKVIDEAAKEGILHCICTKLRIVGTGGKSKYIAMLECSQCPNIWEVELFSVIHRQSRCSKCAITARTFTLSKSRALARKYGGWCPATIYVNNHTKIPFICRKLHKFMATYQNVQQGKWCPRCRDSKAERAMNEYLTKLGIGFEPQQKFDTLRGTKGRLLPCDFYLFVYNSIVEMNGKQHEMSVEIYGGEPRFIIQLKTDEIKYLWCVEHNKSLLCIRYTTFEVGKMEEMFNTFLERVKKGEHVVIDEFREERLRKLKEYAEKGM